jgi:hypothetical protein
VVNPKVFRTEVRCVSDNCNEVPTIVMFEIDEATAAEIVWLAAIVGANDLYKVERSDYRAIYLRYDPEQDPEEAKLAGEDNELRTEADVLNVSDNEFWFSAYIRHTDIEIRSEQHCIDDLVEHFALEIRAAALSDKRSSSEICRK